MNINLVEIFDDQNQLDKKSREFLLNAIERNNKPGFDYLEFKQALIRLQSIDVDPATAIKTAFATASTVGLTRENLLDSADYYLAVLQNEYKQFNNALEKQMEVKVHSREKQKTALSKKIDAMREKIKELQKEQEELTIKLAKIDTDAGSARKKIERTSELFGETLQSITDRIESDIDQIKSHLP